MKKILIIHTDLEIGGVETSLVGLLQTIDYSRYSVDLLLYRPVGPLLKFVPSPVKVLSDDYGYSSLVLPVKEVVRRGHLAVAATRLAGKMGSRRWSDPTYIIKQRAARYAMPFMRRIPGSYDAAISFIDPHYVLSKVDAKVKIGWWHTDFSRIDIDERHDLSMWSLCDYVVSVSDKCREEFIKKHPTLQARAVCMENILSEDFIASRSSETDVSAEMSGPGLRLLSIGRFSEPKNFDNVPDICRRMVERGYDVKWYIIGYGNDEALVRSRIKEAGMEQRVIILGKRENPYPYIRECDFYLQPSRFEGKSVAVREAQMLHKPVIITNFATAKSQLTDGVDGVIVPMDNAGCAEGIMRVIDDKALAEKIVSGTYNGDYSNSSQIEILYKMMK